MVIHFRLQVGKDSSITTVYICVAIERCNVACEQAIFPALAGYVFPDMRVIAPGMRRQLEGARERAIS